MRDPMSAIKRIIPALYYDVPECPCCSSNRTGRFVKNAALLESTDEWMIKEALKSGEYVKPVNTIPDDNLFCLNCGFTWSGEVPIKIMSRYTRDLIKNDRGIVELENAMKEEEREKRKSATGFINSIKRFIG